MGRTHARKVQTIPLPREGRQTYRNTLVILPVQYVPFTQDRNLGTVMKWIGGSLVDNNGLLRAQSPHNHSFNIPDPLRSWRIRYAGSGVYNQ